MEHTRFALHPRLPPYQVGTEGGSRGALERRRR
jgi:hypothetical protein